MFDFDEARYLAAYPDVAEAVRSKQFPSGRQHFEEFGRSEGRSPFGSTDSAPAHAVPEASALGALRFEQRLPSTQTAVDVFRGRWACDLGPLLGVSGTGGVPLFTADRRPQQAAAALGRDEGFSGYDILELGPLEAAHSWQLEQLNAASIIAIETSVEAYLKCLVMKEVLQLKKTKFLLGDALEYLKQASARFDLVFCSGILYHLDNPVHAIELISQVTDRCFVWSHYYDGGRHPVPFRGETRVHAGLAATFWSHTYGDQSEQFWGGNKSTAVWLEKNDLIAAFKHFGFMSVEIINDDFNHPNGPAITFAASRATSDRAHPVGASAT